MIPRWYALKVIAELVRTREEANAAVVVLTMEAENPTGYGRIIRDAAGDVQEIVEQKDCTPEQAAVTECNSGFYCFDIETLFAALEEVSTDNAQGEYYLTDVLGIARNQGKRVLGLKAEDASECLGVELSPPACGSHQGAAAAHQRHAYGQRCSHHGSRHHVDRP